METEFPERRIGASDRRTTPRAIRCEHCQTLLTFDRRGSVVRLYERSATAMPSHEPRAHGAVPRCLVCHAALVPVEETAELPSAQHHVM